MGKLKTALTKLRTDIRALEKSTTAASTNAVKVASNAYHFIRLTDEGINTTYLYINQKLKKDKKIYAEHKGETIREHADSNIANFLKAVSGSLESAVKISQMWDQVIGAIPDELKRVRASLQAVSKQLADKRRKLLQSKKFKSKIRSYEDALADMHALVFELNKAAKVIVKKRPPSPSKLQRNLTITGNTTLDELESTASMEVRELLQKYQDLKETGDEVKRKFREGGDFRAELKMLDQWVSEADDMEIEVEKD